MTIRLFHVSDLHFGRADGEALNWFERLVHAEKPTAVICTGDLTMRARASEYAAARTWLERLGVPVTIEPGNHDIPYHNPLMRLLSPYRRYAAVERALERPIDLPGVALIPLKTTARFQWRTNWAYGRVSARGLVSALTQLRAKPADTLAIILCHHPLIDGPHVHGEARTAGGAAALAALGAAGADAVLSGHVHDPFDVPHPVAGRTVRLIGAGTLSERLRTSRPSFNELIVQDGVLEVRPRVFG
ncbi:metallophosphoesterase family protein [Sphingomonas montana]|uniref:metallophosphoesterase family protein n=1 Tax=Sphingomonas montana TaxID=1843236 RepID=UPI00096E7512|nr:metallophosphoesterase [Sphingomonas montana]